MSRPAATAPREPAGLRLDRLLGLLSSRAAWTAPELAEELGVSVRTVRRDLARMKERGVPLEAERGRGGGVRVPARTGLGRLQLDHREVIDLLLALAVAERLQSPLLLSSARVLRQKLGMAFPAEERRRVSGLRRRILLGASASASVVRTWSEPRAAVLRPVQDAFFLQHGLELSYRVGDVVTERLVEPHYLLSNWPAWYLLVWDHLRLAPRSLRLDRIERARIVPTPFRLREAPSMMIEVGQFFAPL